MPSKPKESSSDWNQCLHCKAVVHFKELAKHRQECGSKQSLSHGFVIGNRLHGVVSLQQELKDTAPVPARLRDDVVFLHPSTMQFCGFCIGGHCIVGKSLIMKSWPQSSINQTLVGLSDQAMRKLGCTKGSMVSVEHFIDSHQIAESIVLIPSTDLNIQPTDENFITYLKKSVVGKFVNNGHILTTSYFGQNFSFTVSSIEPKRSTKKLFRIESESPSDSLEKSFTGLNITDADETEDSIEQIDDIKSPINKKIHLSSTSTPISSKSYSHEPNREESDRSLSLEKTVNESLDENLQSVDVSVQEEEETSTEILNETPVKGRKGYKSSDQNEFSESPSKTKNSFFCTPVESRYMESDLSKTFYKVTSETKFTIKSSDCIESINKDTTQSISYSDLGGLSSQIQTLSDFIHVPLHSPHMFKSYGLPQPHGVLIFGPSGCGKSTLVQAVISELNIHYVTISGPEVWSKFYGETEKKLKGLFQEAKQRSPSLIVIDDIESLCPRRENTNSELEKRVVASFLTLMDGISEDKDDKFVLVLGTTSKPDSIDPALRRPGRFDKEIEIAVPSPFDRREILQKVLRKCQTDLSTDDIAAVADIAHGYVGADLVALVKEASLHAIKLRSDSKEQDIGKLKLTRDDLEYAMNVIQPSAMREVQIQVPKVYWQEIGGQEGIKLKLKQAVEWPLKHPEAFDRMGISPPKGILMYGPPGCSKTMIAKALATESGLNFLAVKGPELFSKWVGESERAVREVFRKARAAAPSIVFFDEIDALAIERGSSSGSSNVADRVLAQLLTEIDGVEKLKDVTIVAATNRPDMIDKALLRPGRIDRILYVPLPDVATRCEIFNIKLSKMPIHDDVTAAWLAEKTDGYTGAEITSVCHEAAMFALQENIHSELVLKSHFEMAVTTVKPRISNSLLNFYENYHKSSGLHTI